MKSNVQRLPSPQQPRGLPHSEECERAVLACCLLKSQSIALIQGLAAEDFYMERHQLIYKAMLELYAAATPIDLRSLQAQLEQAGMFEPVGGVAYLAGLDLDLPDLNRLEFYADIVRERSTLRKLVFGYSELTSGCLEGELNAEQALARSAEMVSAVQLHQGSGHSPTSLAELCVAFDRWEPIHNMMLGLPTGLSDYNSMTLGLQRGKQYIVAGRPGMGKSSFAAGIAVAAADSIPPWRESGDETPARVLVVTLEMLEDEWRDRILAQQSSALGAPSIGLRRIQTGTIGSAGSASREQFIATMNSVSRLNIHFDDRRGITADQIAATAAAHKMQHGLDLLIVDHLGLIRYVGDKKMEVDQLGETSLKLRNLGATNQLNIPVVTLCQLNREVEKRSPPRPKISDLRSSGKIEEHADVATFIFRPAHYMEPDGQGRYIAGDGTDLTHIAEIITAKHRNGQTGRIDAYWEGEVTGFRDLAHPAEEQAAQSEGGYPRDWD